MGRVCQEGASATAVASKLSWWLCARWGAEARCAVCLAAAAVRSISCSIVQDNRRPSAPTFGVGLNQTRLQRLPKHWVGLGIVSEPVKPRLQPTARHGAAEKGPEEVC